MLFVMTVIRLAKKPFQVVAKKDGVLMLVLRETISVVRPHFAIVKMVFEIRVFEKVFQEFPRFLSKVFQLPR